VETSSTGSKNILAGKVEKITFEGTFMRYVVRLGNQDLVVVIRPSLTEKWVDVGEDVTLSFPAEKTHVFPYPEAGLMEEISA
jgi:ABC-type Fe3+/spermidine/putrescine transport system ATPase subunit